MSVIRPTILPPGAAPQPQPQPLNQGKLAAQRAFFAAALGQAAAPVPPQPAASAGPASAPLRPAAPTAQEPPARLLRPGSLLDIRV